MSGAIGLAYLVMLGHGWWTGSGIEPRRQPAHFDTSANVPAVARPDPFKDDPTWHTGPRPAIESPPASSRVETRAIYKCSANGQVTYSGPNDCRGGVVSVLPIEPGPDAASTAAAQSELQRTVARANRQVEAIVEQRAAAERVAQAEFAGQARQQGVPRQAECAQLEQAIKALDEHARQPLPGSEQDRIRAERQRVRDQQHALRC